jgi:hypothetical protein
VQYTRDEVLDLFGGSSVANIVDSNGEYMVDTNWDWQALGVVDGTHNGKAVEYDTQSLDVHTMVTSLDNGLTAKIGQKTSTSREFSIEVYNNVTGDLLRQKSWDYSWDNFDALWPTAANPASPVTCCVSDRWGEGEIRNVHGITGIPWWEVPS